MPSTGYVRSVVPIILSMRTDLDAKFQIYLRFEPGSNLEDVQSSLFDPYGLGKWDESQLDPGQRQPHQRRAPVPTPAKTPISVPSTPLTQEEDVESQVSSKQTIGSSLLAYRDPNEESSDDESESEKPTTGVALTKATSAVLDDQSDDEMDPTGRYIAAKLKVTSLERKLGLAGKQGGKKAGKGNPKVNASTPEPAAMQEYQKLNAQLKQCKELF
jgi:hypothetical protein